MERSQHNIFSKVHHSENSFIVNLLSGNADILSPEEATRYLHDEVLNDPEYIEKGYVVDPAAETALFRQRYLDFLDARERDEIQLFYAPTYACNFNCSYCYQEGYGNQASGYDIKVAAAFFDYVKSAFGTRDKYVTLFGGEPLLHTRENHAFLSYFIDRCNQAGLELAIVTNGYSLTDFIPLLKQGQIREIQITLDGTEYIHNQRRPLKNGAATFGKISGGIDAALQNGLPVNLRVVLDKDNVSNLPELARYAIDKGWTSSELFKTQLGRNYELHYCQSQQSRLYSRIDLYRDLYSLIIAHPHLLEFHKPAYSVSRFLFENNELPDPLFDSCPGCKTEWAFDHTGKIFSCTATVGKPGEELGSFYPEVVLYPDQVELWKERDVLTIRACRECNVRLACGGGCASVAYNRDKNLHAPDCRPVKELLEIGLSLYNQLPS